MTKNEFSDEEAFAKYKLYFEEELGNKIEIIEQVNSANVIIQSNKDNKYMSVEVQLDVNEKMNDEITESIIQFVVKSIEGIERKDVTITKNDKTW